MQNRRQATPHVCGERAKKRARARAKEREKGGKRKKVTWEEKDEEGRYDSPNARTGVASYDDHRPDLECVVYWY